ncbi:HlyC/CorC family transporter [bacterium]|nr:HlyC/CorC family transporter [bacterium]MBT7311508.1 HlyC/CorC family transporter [bacterium]
MELGLLVLLLLLSACFSGSETALFSLTEADMAELGKNSRVTKLLQRTHRLLAAILVGNLLVNIVASVLATSMLVEAFGVKGVVIAIPALTIMLLLFGEITPKMIALRNRLFFSKISSIPLLIWLMIIRPLLDVIEWSLDKMMDWLPYEKESGKPLTMRELSAAAVLATEDGALSEVEGRFLSRLMELKEIEVQEIMIPRTDVVSLRDTMTPDEVLSIASENGFNRYPVTNENEEKPIGFFHLKDLLKENVVSINNLVRDVLFVPETKTVASLMNELQSGARHISIVVDEHGDFVGIATLEDCLEVMTGPWQDETDIHDAEIVKIADWSWLVAGSADIRTVNEQCNTRIENTRDFVTVAGYLMQELGKIPAAGETVRTDEHHFTVLEMDNNKVVRIRIHQLRQDVM